MHDLAEYAEECIQELKEINIPIRDDMIERVVAVPLHEDGCRGHCITLENGSFSIEIWEKMLDDCVGIVRLKSLICHELIHTCVDCMNHAGQYRRYARKADKTYHYLIMTGDDDPFHPENPVLDKIQCRKCKFNQLYRIQENSENLRCIKSISRGLLPLCPYCRARMVYIEKSEW